MMRSSWQADSFGECGLSARRPPTRDLDCLMSHWSTGNMPDCSVRGPTFESHHAQLVMFITTATAIYSLGHGLHTRTAVPRSTQPSTRRGTVTWVSAFGLSNNKWRWWMRMVAAVTGGLTVQVDWLGPGLAAAERLVHIHQMNRLAMMTAS